MNLTTDRLRLREAHPDKDSAFFLKLLNDPEYIRNIRDSGVRTEADAKKFLEDIYLTSYRIHGFGLWVMEEMRTGHQAGVCGLIKRPTLKHPDLGYALLSAYRKRGLVVEAGRAVLDYAKKTLNLKTIQAITTEANKPSSQVLVKLGFKKEGETKDERTGEPLTLYTVSLGGD